MGSFLQLLPESESRSLLTTRVEVLMGDGVWNCPPGDVEDSIMWEEQGFGVWPLNLASFAVWGTTFRLFPAQSLGFPLCPMGII